MEYIMRRVTGILIVGCLILFDIQYGIQFFTTVQYQSIGQVCMGIILVSTWALWIAGVVNVWRKKHQSFKRWRLFWKYAVALVGLAAFYTACCLWIANLFLR